MTGVQKVNKMSGSILGDFFKDIGDGLGKMFDGDVVESVGGILGGTLKGAFRTIGFACKGVGDIMETIFEGEQLTPDDIPDEDKLVLFLASVVAMLAKMAKADGRISKQETEFLASWLDAVELSKEDAQEFKKYANNEAKNNDRTIYDHARVCFAASNGNTEITMDIYVQLWRMALIGDKASKKQQEILREIPPHLGLDVSIYDQVFQCLSEEGTEKLGTFPSEFSLDACYQLLGCSSDVSNDEVKRCYKNQMALYHPDAISGKNLAPGFIEFANQQAAKINEAYETIKNERGMK